MRWLLLILLLVAGCGKTTKNFINAPQVAADSTHCPHPPGWDK